MTPAGLAAALDGVLTGRSAASLAGAVDRLRAAYRSGEPPTEVALHGDREAAAYAAYRMPATAAAVAAALHELAAGLPGWQPRTVVDVGAGTGAACWAVAERWPDAGLLLLEQSEPAVALGRQVAAAGGVLAGAEWRSWRLAGDVELPPTDLLVASYLLGELDERRRAALVAEAARTAQVVLLVEAGTPAGSARVVVARRALLDAGLHVVAPCPHEAACPLAARGDWCHVAVRVERSALHRRLKDGERGWEDEGFAYVAAVRGPVPPRPAARVVRHPQTRKGLVSLELCRQDGTAGREDVGRSRPAYRDARRTGWGDPWPPPPD